MMNTYSGSTLKNSREALTPQQFQTLSSLAGYQNDDLFRIMSLRDPTSINISSPIKPTKSLLKKKQKNQLKSQKILAENGFLKEYINYLKGLFILQELIEPIEKEQLLNFDNERYIEFMVLVSKRSRNYIQKFNLELKKMLTQNPEVYEALGEDMDISSVQAYNTTIISKFNAYNQNIDLLNRKIRKRIRSVSEFVYQSPERKCKYKFLDGYEGPDFTQEEQIAFTYDKYIQYIINSQEISSQHFKNHRLKKVLKGYRSICQIKHNIDKSSLHYQFIQETPVVQSKAQFDEAVLQILLRK